ncbi:MAG: hypothetical protein M1482_18085 [Chloroflexi bacterium]|nr:hypothetical protein [Chloroflexota bacterium]
MPVEHHKRVAAFVIDPMVVWLTCYAVEILAPSVAVERWITVAASDTTLVERDGGMLPVRLVAFAAIMGVITFWFMPSMRTTRFDRAKSEGRTLWDEAAETVDVKKPGGPVELRIAALAAVVVVAPATFLMALFELAMQA